LTQRYWLILLLILTACSGGGTATLPAGETPTAVGTAVPAATATPPPSPTNVTRVSARHVFLIVLENSEYREIIGNNDLPYLNGLAAQYTVADSYYAIRHPSLPNYLALLAGHTFEISTDCTSDCFRDDRNLVDALEAKGKTWKSYQEDLPAACFSGDGAGNYVLKHNPFLYFDDIRNDPQRCNQVVPFTQFVPDLEANRVPDFVWITPNLQHDMHDGPKAKSDRWLEELVPKIFASAAWQEGGVLFITWDEGVTNKGCCVVAAGGRVPLLVISPEAAGGYHITARATHYSLLRTIEDLWGLEHLGRSADADALPLFDLRALTASVKAW